MVIGACHHHLVILYILDEEIRISLRQFAHKLNVGIHVQMIQILDFQASIPFAIQDEFYHQTMDLLLFYYLVLVQVFHLIHNNLERNLFHVYDLQVSSYDHRDNILLPLKQFH